MQYITNLEFPMNQLSSNSQKNGTIEVLRFLFAICIVCIHLYNVSDLGHFKYGHYGVEFFFILSGILMAQSIEKRMDTLQKDIGKGTIDLVTRKLKRIFPYVIIATISLILLYSIKYRNADILDLLMDGINLIPYLFFTNMAGLGETTSMYLIITWYLSALFLSMMILAPIYIKYNSYAKNILFPLLGIFILGYLVLTEGTYTFYTQHPWGVNLGLLRAIGETALGASCYNLSMYLRNNYKLTTLGKTAVLSIELLCIAVLMIFIEGSVFYDSPSSILLIFLIMETLIYSDITWNLPNTKITSALGQISLPLFLTHPIIIDTMMLWYGTDWFYGRVGIGMTSMFALALVTYIVVEYLLPKVYLAKRLFVKPRIYSVHRRQHNRRTILSG